jgi:transcriptional regulator with XRE-family HTH domain
MNEKKIKKRLIDLGLTQTELSQQINIPRNRINDAIKGRREGRRYTQQILDFLYPLINSKKGNLPTG